MLKVRYILRRWVGVPILFGSLAIVGCATSKAPVEDIARVDRAISSAKSHGADVYAPLDFRNAQQHLAQAKEAMADKEHDKAKHLADRAMIEAETAEEKALSAKTQRLSEEMQKNVDTLRQEIDRVQQ